MPPEAKEGPQLPGWREQAATLSERYLDVVLGDLMTLLAGLDDPHQTVLEQLDARVQVHEVLEHFDGELLSVKEYGTHETEGGKQLVGAGADQRSAAQQRTWQEIRADMESPSRMYRLLQGDVGCGKTLVSLLAMLQIVANCFQSDLMKPT